MPEHPDHSPALPRVAWIGLGAMGAPMARRLGESGVPVTAFDVNPQAAPALAPAVTAAASAREAVAGAGVVAVMVATPAQLEELLHGEGGIAGALDPSAVLLVLSTVGPAAVEAAAAGLAGRIAGVVDAPVSGGTARAGTGELLIMVGGADAPVAAVRPLLDLLAATAPVVGGRVGDGQRFKAVNQLLCGVHIAAAGEALALADAMGLDLAQVHEVLGAGAAASFMFSDRGARMIAEEEPEVRSALDIFVKDMALVTDAARTAGQPVPLAAAAEQIYQRGKQAGLGRQDDSAVFRLARGR